MAAGTWRAVSKNGIQRRGDHWPNGANLGLGCGNRPIAACSRQILDLSGRADCFLAAKKVGLSKVIGDMTPE